MRMNGCVSKNELVKQITEKMNSNYKESEMWLNTFTEVLYDNFKQGKSVTLTGFGGFYLKQRSSGTVFKFNPGQKLRALFGWSSTYKGKL